MSQYVCSSCGSHRVVWEGTEIVGEDMLGHPEYMEMFKCMACGHIIPEDELDLNDKGDNLPHDKEVL